jgi:hypothetical protein
VSRPSLRLIFALLLGLALPGAVVGTDVDGSGDPGLLIIEIDGLSEAWLRDAIDEGTMPFVAGLVESGSHVLDGWDTIGSSTTPVSQAGILHGDSAGIIGYRWWERDAGELAASSSPADAKAMERTVSGAADLLADGGASIGNVLSGGAERTLMTVSDMSTRGIATEIIELLLDPPRAAGVIVGFTDALGTEMGHSLAGEAPDIEPTAKRKVPLPILGPALESVLTDLASLAVIGEIRRGTPILYGSLLPYDEVAHYAGPDHVVSADSLARIDRALEAIARATESAPRPYHLVVLADHGQTPGESFEARYDMTLGELVGDQMGDGSGPIALGSGSLAHVYLAATGERLSREAIEARHPGLVGRLAAHPGIGIVVTRDDRGRLIADGPDGTYDLSTDTITGTDPLEVYGPHTADSLRHIGSPEHAGDLVILSTYDPVTGEVAPFERQASSHGGLGGPQTRPAFLYPAALEPPGTDLELVGAEAVHAKLREWMAANG